MATAHTVTIDLSLADDRVVDLFVLQWHTPLSGFSPLDATVVSRRRDFLRSFRDWFLSGFKDRTPQRPCIILMPELSLACSLESEIDLLASSADRPLIVVGGLEFMDWTTYLGTLSRLPAMPRPDCWVRDGGPHLYVNAAMVWVRNRDGQLLTFLQPKRNPSDPEDANVFRCEQILLFKSRDQMSGRRLNFCVQICSDLTSVDSVRQLRRCCEEAAPGSSLDFTFVLQWNENQEAGQFKQGAQAYFSPPDGHINTEPGCLVFVNNASMRNGKSITWGRSKFHFCYDRRWRPSAPLPTLWLQNDGVHDHQAAVLRDPGPAVYWLRYKPHYLVSRRPGSGQTGPFFESFASCCIAPQELFDAGRFAPLLPVLHWLQGEWHEGVADFQALLRDSGVADGAVTAAGDIYEASTKAWLSALAAQNDLAARSMTTYFEAHDRPGYPRTCNEPAKWQDGASRGAKKFQFVFTLLEIASRNRPSLRVRPDPGQVRHGSGDAGLSVTLLWGGGEKVAKELVMQYLNSLRNRAPAEMLAQRLVVVLVEPVGSSDPADLTQLLVKAHREITRAETAADAPPHLRLDGDVVDPLAGQQVFCLSDQYLISRADAASSPADLEARLGSAVGLSLHE